MRSFTKNRWWTYLLTLALCFACWGLMSDRASADGSTLGLGDGTQGGGVPTGTGDPDIPQNPKNSPIRGAGHQAPSNYSMTGAAGDGAVGSGVWMIRLRVVLQGVKSFYLRY